MRAKSTYPAFVKRNWSSIFSFVNLSFIQGSNVLVQILLIPIITRIVGLSEFGLIMLASSYAALVSILVNYGSNQSGVKDIALHKGQPQALSHIFYHIYLVRIILFLLGLIITFIIYQTGILANRGQHFMFAQALILSEMLNPFFFFVGIQQLFLYNIVTLISKALAAILIILWIHAAPDGIWVNFLLGITSAAGYFLLCLFLIRRHQLFHINFSISSLKNYIKQNFYLTGNNICVQLQQSFFLFAVSGMNNPLLLGAYSLCDKFVWSFRMLIISCFNVIYPRAAIAFRESPAEWLRLKQKLSKVVWIIFSIIALLLFFLADWLVLVVTGELSELSGSFIRSICLVPLIAGLNSLNVTDLLLRNRYPDIFRIALILLGLSVIISFCFMQWANSELFGLFPILTEIFSIPLYLFFIKRADNNTFSK